MTITEQSTIEVEGTEPEGTEPEAKERAKTTYVTDFSAIEALDELPDNPKIKREGGGRSKIYHNLLEQVAEQGVDGKWRMLARFGTSSGAKTVALALNRQVEGKIGEGEGMVKPAQVKSIPEYEGFHWTFDSRRVPNEQDPSKMESVLYCKLVEDEAAAE